MAADPAEVPSGQHGLGPHVVGLRVVIRSLVPGETGPTGGPALTDVLGVCERWSDGEAVVRRSDGHVVTVPTRLIVSGKPVPPRASRFDRLTRAGIDAHLPEPGLPVWLGSVSQLARRRVADLDVTATGTAASLSVGHRGRTATATLTDDWVVVDRLDHPDLLGPVVQWAAEQGATTLAVTDPQVSEHASGVGLVHR